MKGDVRHLRHPRLWIFAVAIAVAGVTIAVVVALTERVDDARRAQVAVIHLDELAAASNGLPWDAEHRPYAEVVADIREFEARAREQLVILRRIGETAEIVRIAALEPAYYTALERQADVVRFGDEKTQSIFDAREVRPLAAELEALLETAGRVYGERAGSTVSNSRLWLGATLLAAFLGLGLLFWRYRRLEAAAVAAARMHEAQRVSAPAKRILEYVDLMLTGDAGEVSGPQRIFLKLVASEAGKVIGEEPADTASELRPAA
jgi:hypothetical protein